MELPYFFVIMAGEALKLSFLEAQFLSFQEAQFLDWEAQFWIFQEAHFQSFWLIYDEMGSYISKNFHMGRMFHLSLLCLLPNALTLACLDWSSDGKHVLILAFILAACWFKNFRFFCSSKVCLPVGRHACCVFSCQEETQ